MKTLSSPEEFIERLEKYRDFQIIILVHINSDPDSTASAFGLQELLKKLAFKDVKILAPEGLSELSKRIMCHFNLDLSDKFDANKKNTLYIAVDFSSSNMIGSSYRHLLSQPLFIVDHHSPPGDLTEVCEACFIREASSTVELITDLFEVLDIAPSSDIASILLIGLAVETSKFTRLDSSVLNTLCRLHSWGADAKLVSKLMDVKMSFDERMARLKSAQRMVLKRVYSKLLAFSYVGSYHSSAARAIQRLGADLVAVATESNGEVKVTFRSTEEFYESTRIDIGVDICAPLAKLLRGNGGGHHTAGGVSSSLSLEDTLKIVEYFVVALVSRRLGKK